MLVTFFAAQSSALALQPAHARSAAAHSAAAVRGAAVMSAEDDAAYQALLAHLRAPIKQAEGGWGDTALRGGGKDQDRFGKGPTPDVEEDDGNIFLLQKEAAAEAPAQSDDPDVQWGGGLKWDDQGGTFEGQNAAGGTITTDGNVGNYRRASDKLKEADVERRKEEEAIFARENEVRLAREAKARKVALMQQIPDETKAGTVDDYMYKEGVQDILDKLDYDLIGLKPVKTRVREIASLLVVDKMRLKLGLETSVPSLHMGFTGAPGTGKTTVALRMGQILQRMGYCRSGHVVVATRDDLVGQYVGHTAPKTKEMVKKAMGGILLVDEAYYLYNAANDRDYGQESIEILLNVMENNKEDLIVVLAGYKDKMDKFYGFIPGMASRIGNHVEFPDYEDDELTEIGKVMCRECEYKLGPGAEVALKAYLSKRKNMPFFANARTVRNAIDLARMGSAIRVFNEKISPASDGMVSEEELMTIMPEDFPAAEDGLTSE